MKPRWKEALLLLPVGVVGVVGWISVDLALEGKIVPSGLAYPLGLTAAFFAAHLLVRAFRPRCDPYLFPLGAMLSMVGIILLHRLNSHMAGLQAVWIGVALAVMVSTVIFLKDYRVLERYRYSLGLAGLVLLAVTMVFGREVNGARLWLVLGPLRFQPSEAAKILLAVFFAAYLAEKGELLKGAGRRVAGIRWPRARDLGPLLTVWALSLLILVFQRDLGSSLLFFGLFLAVLYVAASRPAFVVVGLVLFLAGAACAFFLFPHVEQRVKVWLDPLNPETVKGESYQIAQSLFAFAEGGLSGKGLGRGNPVIIPFVETDFIYAAAGEELGLLGAALLLLLYILLVGRGLHTAAGCTEPFGRLLAAGLSAVVGIQALIIMGGVTRLVPLTGITLPFVSYGGSSLAANFLLLGLLLCVSRGGREGGG